ncbi:uncharacterized protein EAF01_002798 [Botrytis porri]|uniref:uncharacterized protein n=1 Tax=Botrytis porri TaxID=87229 RepID=UPI001902A75D|nr:uncharacterized protein EAF01_002798 [Botrytis porri]KAF7911291.1 hypothetical protein EAF01_002798 [Botrytis porri]
MGVTLIPDMFSTCKSAHGCGHVVRTASQGTRTMSTDYITSPMKNSDISIKTNTYNDRINLKTDKSGALRANGVFLQDNTGQKSFVKARKEVIISAGTYGSLGILLRSGISSKQEVEKLGIQSQVDPPGVGKNLMDHLVVLSFYEVSTPALTNDHLIWHTKGKSKSLTEYQTDKPGFFSQFPFGTFAFARLDSRLSDSPLWNSAPRTKDLDQMSLSPTQPRVEFWNTECYSPNYMFRNFPPDGNFKSSDPTENPVVNHRYLEDPFDMLVFSEGCCMATEIAMKGAGTKDIWVLVIRSNADACYHPAGTCKMGHPNDPFAVLDSKLKVRGITDLRVADASVTPSLIGGHPQMAVYGIAEKAADLIIFEIGCVILRVEKGSVSPYI